MCKIFSSLICTHSHTILTCMHVTTKTPRHGTSILRARGREIYLERVPSVVYLYRLCPGLSNPITDRCQTFGIAAAQISVQETVAARDSVITCCVEARRELGFALSFCLQRARIDHWVFFFLSPDPAYELGNRKQRNW